MGCTASEAGLHGVCLLQVCLPLHVAARCCHLLVGRYPFPFFGGGTGVDFRHRGHTRTLRFIDCGIAETLRWCVQRFARSRSRPTRRATTGCSRRASRASAALLSACTSTVPHFPPSKTHHPIPSALTLCCFSCRVVACCVSGAYLPASTPLLIVTALASGLTVSYLPTRRVCIARY